MADVYFHLKPQADADRRAERQKVIAMRRLGYEKNGLHVYLDSDTAREMLLEIDRKYFRQEFFELADPDSNVEVICRGCRRRHIIPRSVPSFKCPCSPHEERSTGYNRAELAERDLLTARKPAQSGLLTA
ncbi:MAG: hypothetical protein JWM87_728 [Candidatus Eremiobacteraeota bacterium]|nr:hypothetical protein [Candidatus Eremiobacteraeota bacterium]